MRPVSCTIRLIINSGKTCKKEAFSPKRFQRARELTTNMFHFNQADHCSQQTVSGFSPKRKDAQWCWKQRLQSFSSIQDFIHVASESCAMPARTGAACLILIYPSESFLPFLPWSICDTHWWHQPFGSWRKLLRKNNKVMAVFFLSVRGSKFESHSSRRARKADECSVYLARCRSALSACQELVWCSEMH